MEYAPLSVVRDQIAEGRALPFDIYASDGTLLLAKSTFVETRSQLDALTARGVQVRIEDLPDPSSVVDHVPNSQIPEVWRAVGKRVERLLSDSPREAFDLTLQQASAPLQALIRRDPDLAIVQVISSGLDTRSAYGVHHAMQVSVVAMLLATRLGWSATDMILASKTSLAMNVSIFKLLGILAVTRNPPNAAQRHEIHDHPLRSRELLKTSGVIDPMLLTAVEQHHERSDGTGYPRGLKDVVELANLVRCADAFVTGLHELSGHGPLAADRLLRKIFLDEERSVYANALVKEMGVYPPGSVVELASGERGVVVRRGEKITTPMVAVYTDSFLRPLSSPVLRNTADQGSAVVGAIQPDTHRLTTKRLEAILLAS